MANHHVRYGMPSTTQPPIRSRWESHSNTRPLGCLGNRGELPEDVRAIYQDANEESWYPGLENAWIVIRGSFDRYLQDKGKTVKATAGIIDRFARGRPVSRVSHRRAR
jgi:hypothetical protein